MITAGDGRVLVRLRIDPGDLFAGTIAFADRPEMTFCGWLELMVAIDSARAELSDRQLEQR